MYSQINQLKNCYTIHFYSDRSIHGQALVITTNKDVDLIEIYKRALSKRQEYVEIENAIFRIDTIAGIVKA